MNGYISNLWQAFLGLNPLRTELEEVRRKCDSAADELRQLTQMYAQALDKWDAAVKAGVDLQAVVENLRARIREKDAEIESLGRDYRDRMESMKAGYQERINEYTRKIDELQKGGN